MGVPHRYLFHWQREETEFSKFAKYIRALKGSFPLDEYHVLADKFVFELWKRNRRIGEKCFAFVPLPPRKIGDKDHAYQFASALSDRLNGEIFTCLARTGSKEQKKLKRKDRASVRMKCISGQRLPPNGAQIILVDDLVTTGSTMRAALEALNGQGPVEFWSLAFRDLG